MKKERKPIEARPATEKGKVVWRPRCRFCPPCNKEYPLEKTKCDLCGRELFILVSFYRPFNIELEKKFNFGTIADEKLYRSAQPDDEFLGYLKKQYGIKTVAVLRTGVLAEEEEFCRSNHIQIIHLPLKAWVLWPEPEEVQNFLDFLADPKNQPALIHCFAGRDRTGTVTALYRLRYQSWKLEKALKEMEEWGAVDYWRSLIQKYE